jgi:hypothetical protein
MQDENQLPDYDTCTERSPRCKCCKTEFIPPARTANEGPEYTHASWNVSRSKEETARKRRVYRLWSKQQEQYRLCSQCCGKNEKARAVIRSDVRAKHIAELGPDPTKCVFSDEVLQKRKEVKAKAVETLSLEFCTALKLIIPERYTYYLHALVWHFPTWIRMLDVDIMDVSGSGIEQINQETKRAVKGLVMFLFCYLLDVQICTCMQSL